MEDFVVVFYKTQKERGMDDPDRVKIRPVPMRDPPAVEFGPPTRDGLQPPISEASYVVTRETMTAAEVKRLFGKTRTIYLAQWRPG